MAPKIKSDSNQEPTSESEVKPDQGLRDYKLYLGKRLKELEQEHHGNQTIAWNSLLIEELYTLGARPPKE